MPKVATVTLSSSSTYSQSRFHETPKEPRELHDDYEKRTWRERLHTDEKGNVFIPPMQFKNCLAEAGKYLSMQIPGKGKATFTKHIEGGIAVEDGLQLPVKKDNIGYEWVLCSADGKRGGSKKVKKCFGIVPKWQGEVKFVIFDDIVTKEAFETHLIAAGRFVGLGRWRPRNNGMYGRYEVKKIKWEDMKA